jgi:uncharacterized membrane protein YphA (DoxX/SURF4 family)
MLVLQGAAYLGDLRDFRLETLLLGLIATAGGAALLLGFATPVAGLLASLGSLMGALPSFPHPGLNLFETGTSVVLVLIMTAAIVLLGPGAYSLDARLFGRRQIVIPHSSQSQKP